MTKQATVTVLALIISALVGVVTILAGDVWSLSLQSPCPACGANSGAGMLVMAGWVWLVGSLLAVAATIIRAVARRLRAATPAQH